MRTRTNVLIKATCFAIAALGASAFAASVVSPSAAYAKNGNGGGNGGGNGAGKSSSAKEDRAGQKASRSKGKSGKGDRSAKGAGATAAKAKRTVRTDSAVVAAKARKKSLTGLTEVGTRAALHPSEKGKWNAANASQKALDAHIRNQNFNGTIGALAQFQLAAKAAAGDDLTEAERAALDRFVDTDAIEVTDRELADLLNAGAIDGDPVFAVDDGIAQCTANCDGVDLDLVQADLDIEADRLRDDAEQEALDGFLAESESRIVADSNKTLSPDRTEDLLDALANDLGVSRAQHGGGPAQEAHFPEGDAVIAGAGG